MRALTLYALTLVALLVYIYLNRHERNLPALAAFALACLASLGAAWLGMDFSPSFTMMLLFANLLLCALAELARMAGRELCAGKPRGEIAANAVHGALFAIGMLLSFPSVFIYAAGDDLISLCERSAAIAGFLLALLAALVRRYKKLPLRPGAIALNLLSLCAACFALACGLRSPALLPYGAGLLLMCAALQCEQRQILRALLFCAGLACASMFAVAPMLF